MAKTKGTKSGSAKTPAKGEPSQKRVTPQPRTGGPSRTPQTEPAFPDLAEKEKTASKK